MFCVYLCILRYFSINMFCVKAATVVVTGSTGGATYVTWAEISGANQADVDSTFDNLTPFSGTAPSSTTDDDDTQVSLIVNPEAIDLTPLNIYPTGQASTVDAQSYAFDKDSVNLTFTIQNVTGIATTAVPVTIVVQSNYEGHTCVTACTASAIDTSAGNVNSGNAARTFTYTVDVPAGGTTISLNLDLRKTDNTTIAVSLSDPSNLPSEQPDFKNFVLISLN